MAKWPNNRGAEWTPQQNRDLRQLARENTPTRIMALKLGRTVDAIRTHASDIDLSLKPTNQSPYNRRKP